MIALMALCSFSVPFFFARRGRLHPWKHVVAPVLAADPQAGTATMGT